MSEEEKHIWDQMEGEPDLWYGRFTQYLRMGSKRSVNALYSKTQRAKKSEKEREFEAGGKWYDAEKEWNWKERARLHDEHVRAEEDRIIAEEKDKVIRSGFALMHKRVEELDRLSRKLIKMTNEENKVWIPEIKTTTFGEDSNQVVEKVTFNAPLFMLIEKYFSGIAAELGERVKKKDITVTELPPNVYLEFDPDKDGSVND